MSLITENRADLEALGASARAIDAEQVTYTLTFETRPEIEVDPSDGGITLNWFNQAERRAFGLYFHGNGVVMGVVSPSCEEYPIWTLKVEDVAGSMVRIPVEITGTVRSRGAKYVKTFDDDGRLSIVRVP
jgi:hypothetical protein